MSQSPGPTATGRSWLIDGNNVFGSRADGWWNDRPAAQARFTQRVAEWCRTHDDEVTLVFDAPVAAATAQLAGGNLDIVEAPRRGRDAADDDIVQRVDDADPAAAELTVVTSDRGLRRRLPDWVSVWGTGRFREMIGY
jgi:predicted RNA-binding protein with PIN domain